MARVQFGPELTALIQAQRYQDQKKDEEALAVKLYNSAIASGETTLIANATERLDDAVNFHNAAILERIDAERNHRTWVERQQDHTAERKTA